MSDTQDGAAKPVELDAVEVPADVLPGSKFVAYTWGMRAGKRVGLKKDLYRASGCEPTVQARSVQATTGPRHAYRPSAVARKNVTAGAIPRARSELETTPVAPCTWSTQEWLPFETHKDDVGWLPGPVGGNAGRALPEFTGAPVGPTDKALDHTSTARRIMQSVQFTAEYLKTIVKFAREHARVWATAHTPPDSIERAFQPAKLENAHVELWFASRVRVAMLNPAMPSHVLWQAGHVLSVRC